MHCSNSNIIFSAQFRGPGVQHNFDDSDHSGYEQDNGNQRSQAWSSTRGPFILPQISTEILTDSDDTDMFDRDEEEKDLDNQVKTSTTEKAKDGTVPNVDALPEKLDPAHFAAAIQKSEGAAKDAEPAKSEKKD